MGLELMDTFIFKVDLLSFYLGKFGQTYFSLTELKTSPNANSF